MAALSCHFHSTNYYLNSQNFKSRSKHFVSCTAQPTQSNIKVPITCNAFFNKFNSLIQQSIQNCEVLFNTPFEEQVVINGAAKEIGRAAVAAVTKARGMEVAGAVDTYHVGEDIGKVFVSGVIIFSC